MANKASSLAYNFMLALFPATIFLFTLIPYIPIRHFQDNLLTILGQILPNDAYIALKSTIIDIVKTQNAKLFSFGFLTALFFATNGVSRLMQAFNKSSLINESRSYLKRRWVALVLTVVSFSLPFAEIYDSGFFDVMTFWVVVMALFIYKREKQKANGSL